MKSTTRLASDLMFLIIALVLVGWFLVLPTPAAAQSQGNNAVYYQAQPHDTMGTCCKGSGAFIDASMFANSPPPPVDFCSVLYYVLTHGYPSSGTVIDARGLNSSNTTMTCASGTTPWNNGSSVKSGRIRGTMSWFVDFPSPLLRLETNTQETFRL